ncbi:RNA helicase [Shewanella colwelliana]|uniref:RNA helicase n=1 Tax=Shewanella colwelliana TaxID=23 RepID=A0A1E5ITB5_SHECO|nr:DEAD/DEAH box helicase [Shewanella colwelliana]OEG73732.1 RNA helicase [Shewanella colwelliana]GIU43829.1 RNA helicase [Shewanella colwelliana]
MTQATPVNPSAQQENSAVSFAQMNLAASLQSRLAHLGYTQATPIQAQAIPVVLAGRDLLAGANTGSGKTAAFALPLLQNLVGKRASGGNFVSALVLVPTRELAQQVADSFLSYGAELVPRAKVVAVYGGVSVNTQMLSLRGGADVLVATPGRLLDLISSNAIKLSQLKSLVLDEADRMLNLGFTEELSQILALLPAKKQTLLFSATFPEEVQTLTSSLLDNPFEIQLQSDVESTIEQKVYTVNRERKNALLAELIKANDWRQVLIFASAKNSCNRIAQKLAKQDIAAEVFHSDKAQGTRNRLLESFKQGDVTVLVATDIASRGIDIDKLPVVINYELPRSPADYMHRIGRSGRAGAAGEAISLISHEDYHHFSIIEKKNKIRLVRLQYPGFEADEEAPEDCPSRLDKPMAKPEGTGKKKRKKLPKINEELWNSKS